MNTKKTYTAPEAAVLASIEEMWAFALSDSMDIQSQDILPTIGATDQL